MYRGLLIALIFFSPIWASAATAKVLVVAGGGGGGANDGGGGGAGGVMYDSARVITAGSYTVTVGAGGIGATYTLATDQITGRTSGSNSIFDAGGTEIKALGGGYGGADVNPYNASVQDGATGGSGGGACRQADGGDYGSAGAGSGTGVSYANTGGVGDASNSGGGGGGGAGAAGSAPTGGLYSSASETGGVGGIGIADADVGNLLSMASAPDTDHIAGGGGGSTWNISSNTAAGGNGGGGTGGREASVTSGADNTGGGGGAVSYEAASNPVTVAGSGGSGIVIVVLTTADWGSISGGDASGTSGSETWVKFTSSGTLTLTAAGGGSTKPAPTFQGAIMFALVPLGLLATFRRKMIALGLIVALCAIVAPFLLQKEPESAGNISIGAPAQAGPTYFAEIDKDGVVQRVIVADQAFIDSGKVGNPKNWVQTSMDGSVRKNGAGKGYTYNKDIDAFVAPKPSEEATLNTSTAKWELPLVEVQKESSATSTRTMKI